MEKWPRSTLTSGAGRCSLCLSSLAQKHRVIYIVRVPGPKVLLKESPAHGLGQPGSEYFQGCSFHIFSGEPAPGITHSLCKDIFLVCSLSWPYTWQHCSDESLSYYYQDLLLIPAHCAPRVLSLPACTGAVWVIPLQLQASVFALVELHEIAVSPSFFTVLELDWNYSLLFYQP